MSQGEMKALRADFDQPLAAVHHTRLARRGRKPVLALEAPGRSR